MPRAVFNKQIEWRQRLEAEPVEYFGRRNDALIATSKEAVGALLHMRTEDFGLVTNATEGINAYLQSLDLRAGDELLATSHVYNAVRQAMRLWAARWKATYREIEIRTPVKSASEATAAILAGLSERTRLLCVDHVASPTALIFPVEEIVAACEKRAVDVLIDGAHAPGMLDLDVPAIGAAAYAGNLHKWCCVPKGSAFLWVRPDRQKNVHPCVVSHYLGEGFAREFDWQGTRDLSGWFTIPDSLRFMSHLGWQNVRRHNHEMAVWAQEMLAERWGAEPLGPADGSVNGSMATLPLPGKLAGMTQGESRVLQQALYDEDKVEAPLIPWQGRWHLRVSCQIYNTPADYERVADAIDRRRG